MDGHPLLLGEALERGGGVPGRRGLHIGRLDVPGSGEARRLLQHRVPEDVLQDGSADGPKQAGRLRLSGEDLHLRGDGSE